MFGFLKKKISNVIESISKKKEEEEKFEESVEQIEEKLQTEPKETIKQIEKLAVEPELKEEIKTGKTKQEIKLEIKHEEIKESQKEKIVEEISKGPELPVEGIKEIIKEEPVLKEFVKKEIQKVHEEVREKPKEEKISFFKKVFKKIIEKKLSEDDVNPTLTELQYGLIEADVAYEVAEKIKNDLKNTLLNTDVKRSEVKSVIVESLKNSLMEILDVPTVDLAESVKSKKPYVILFLGFNGSGKTTSLAKVGKWLKDQNYLCVFAAADTFRAASLEQLEEHGRRSGIDVIKHDYGADPAAVVYDAVEHAKSKGKHFVLADTAGRIHTNKDLLDEMKKIVRVNKPDLKVLVIDSMTGNDAVLQARMFNEIGVDAVIFTKVDVNEKGGAILSVTHEIKKPILFLCNGQEYENLIPFNAKEFVDKLVDV